MTTDAPFTRSAPAIPATLLRVENLCVRFTTDHMAFDAVDGVDFSIRAGRIFCLVGESGCGKSLTAKSLLRLVPENAQATGRALLNGLSGLHGKDGPATPKDESSEDILALPESALRRLRGRRISMIFQEPMTALNPVLRVGDQVMEPLRLHLNMSRAQARQRCVELFHQVGIPAAEKRLDDYPHQLSGGMRQRVMIAMALACEPCLLLADEPTTALDVTIQWQILQLIQGLTESRGMGVLLITHDLGVVAQVAHEVGVMYAGRMVESGPVDQVLGKAAHPYTRGLLFSAPSRESRGLNRLPVIGGSVPPPGSMPPGCPFHPRCGDAMPICTQHMPPATTLKPSSDCDMPETSGASEAHTVRCWLHCAPPRTDKF